LLGLRKIIAWVAVKLHTSYELNWDQFLGKHLGRIEEIEPERQGVFLVNDLNTKFPFRPIA